MEENMKFYLVNQKFVMFSVLLLFSLALGQQTTEVKSPKNVIKRDKINKDTESTDLSSNIVQALSRTEPDSLKSLSDTIMTRMDVVGYSAKGKIQDTLINGTNSTTPNNDINEKKVNANVTPVTKSKSVTGGGKGGKKSITNGKPSLQTVKEGTVKQ
jgi:hypothetical protein